MIYQVIGYALQSYLWVELVSLALWMVLLALADMRAIPRRYAFSRAWRTARDSIIPKVVATFPIAAVILLMIITAALGGIVFPVDTSRQIGDTGILPIRAWPEIGALLFLMLVGAGGIGALGYSIAMLAYTLFFWLKFIGQDVSDQSGRKPVEVHGTVSWLLDNEETIRKHQVYSAYAGHIKFARRIANRLRGTRAYQKFMQLPLQGTNSINDDDAIDRLVRSANNERTPSQLWRHIISWGISCGIAVVSVTLIVVIAYLETPGFANLLREIWAGS